MYILFRHFKILPRVYYEMSEGDQLVIKGFVSNWADEMEALKERIDQEGRE